MQGDWLKLCWLSFWVLFLYIINGYIMELIFRSPDFRSHGWYFTLLQYLSFVALSYLHGVVTKKVSNLPTSVKDESNIWERKNFASLASVSLLTLTTVALSTVSVGYINYPTQLLFKSCKVVPVLIGRFLILGKRFTPFEFSGATLMSLGMIFYTLADAQMSPTFDVIGVIMVLVSLIADAMIGNVQEKVMRDFRLTNRDLIYVSYLIGSVILFICLFISGHLYSGLIYYNKDPAKLYFLSFLYSLSGYAGLVVLLHLIKNFGAFVTAIVTTFRKALTITGSFLLFPKPFTTQYLWSGALLFAGLTLCLLNSNRKKNETKKSVNF